METLKQRLPDPISVILSSETEFNVLGHNNIILTSSSSQRLSYLRMSVTIVATSECGICDNGVDYCVKIPSVGHLIQEVITSCKFGSTEMTIYLFIIIMDIE